MKQLPQCSALVLCATLHQDPASRQFTLLGLFNEVAASGFPAPLQCYLYALLTDGLGECVLSVRLSDSDAIEGQEIERSDVRFSSPLHHVEAVYSLEVVLPSPGVYHLELAAAGEVIATRRIVARAG